jgi:hypothetical protein
MRLLPSPGALSGCVLALAVAASAACAQDAPPPQATRLAGIDAFVTVPDLFDTLHADAANLAAYGFPPRPDPVRSPLAYMSWRQAVEGMQRIVPLLQSVPVQHRPIQRNAAASSLNWSGYVAAAPAFSYGGQSLIDIAGDWQIPIAQPAFRSCHKMTEDLAVYSSTWVGLDGDGSGDVLQAGTETDATCSAGTLGTYQGAWYEWYPYNEVRITNLVIAPGGAVYVHVWATSATRGHAYIADKSQHRAVSLAFDAPPGTSLIGNSAEWVVERPYVDGELALLTNYVQEFLANATATDAQGTVYAPGLPQTGTQPPALPIQMTDNANEVISVPALLGQNAIWFTDRGPAVRDRKE